MVVAWMAQQLLVADTRAVVRRALVLLLAGAPAEAGAVLAPEVYSGHVDMYQRLLVRIEDHNSMRSNCDKQTTAADTNRNCLCLLAGNVLHDWREYAAAMLRCRGSHGGLRRSLSHARL